MGRDQNRYVKRLWSDVRVGDVIHLSCNEVIPADMVVLNSSDEHGICFIESSNLDGESNLKQRQSVKGLNLGLQEEFQVSQFNYMMEVGPPTTKMYHFTGTIPLSTGERVPLSKDNLLLRDCTLRNTDYIEGVVVYAGRETKAMLNNGGTRYKRSRLERRMNLEVIWCVVILFFMCLISATGSGLWQVLHHFLPSSSLGLCEYEVLHVLPFDSNRKRMSIIVRHPHTYQKILYCKGADSAILDNLSRDVDEQTKLRVFRTQQHLNTYSKLGLRVLCMAKRVLSDSEYESWAAGHSVAENSLGGRERKLHDSYCRIEKNLSATGIEDRLQDGVPETIQALRKAGIVVWVLTGDKQETAINIAYSCALFQPNMEIIKLNARTKDQAERTINFFLQQIQQQEELRELSQVNGECVPPGGQSSAPAKERGLVVDGRTLLYILDRRANLKKKFLSLAKQCSAVLCCRATPLQKALIVRSAKDSLKVLTLAVGDGANDVSMIQTADVGVGISGLEGRQAVMASDYAIARFRHLEKLLLVHGHWCYNRLARIILYFFYKNASFVLILLWYQLYNGFSGSSMIDQMYLMVFNLFFTSIPPIVVGIYDKDAPEEVLLAEPHLYSQGRTSSVYQPSSFWFNILDALYQSIILFFITALVSLKSTRVLGCSHTPPLPHTHTHTQSTFYMIVQAKYLDYHIKC
ncbi:putative phospholipid-transporting ATPase VA [Portunus trituberculatus]|uniref:Phospholipid-transporting ATPase n=1 Tax=Portunus trituberculatus TaxID=210409 RepID=A0A5B7E975_PORTR|nr:putative phospholipid-transporting ATPase VA [Portunus trituberculatus]